jgi:hypothetical protein
MFFELRPFGGSKRERGIRTAVRDLGRKRTILHWPFLGSPVAVVVAMIITRGAPSGFTLVAWGATDMEARSLGGSSAN